MKVSAKVDYALRAAVQLAAAEDGASTKAEAIASAQDIPLKFLENILQGLRNGGLVTSRRGPDGGHALARPAAEITLADVIRAIDGPMANIGGRPPEDFVGPGTAAPLRDVWVALRAALRSVMEEVTLADVASGNLPPVIEELTGADGAWQRR